MLDTLYVDPSQMINTREFQWIGLGHCCRKHRCFLTHIGDSYGLFNVIPPIFEMLETYGKKQIGVSQSFSGLCL